MKLDNEPQRQQLLQIISSLPINGNLEQVTQAANVLHSLAQAVRDAQIIQMVNVPQAVGVDGSAGVETVKPE